MQCVDYKKMIIFPLLLYIHNITTPIEHENQRQYCHNLRIFIFLSDREMGVGTNQHKQVAARSLQEGKASYLVIKNETSLKFR